MSSTRIREGLTRDVPSLALQVRFARPNRLSGRFVEPSKGYKPPLVFRKPAMAVPALSFSAAAGSDVASQFQSLAQNNDESAQDWLALAQAARDSSLSSQMAAPKPG